MKIPAFVFALIFFFVLPASAFSLRGQVVSVQDGDTITIQNNQRKYKIGLAGIDCPESGQAFGRKAREFTESKAFKQYVLVEMKDTGGADKTDQYRRLVGTVYLPDGQNLNQLLLTYGLAWWSRSYAPDNQEFEKLESEARVNKRGLWADKNPVPPWEWEWRKPKLSDKNLPGLR